MFWFSEKPKLNNGLQETSDASLEDPDHLNSAYMIVSGCKARTCYREKSGTLEQFMYRAIADQQVEKLCVAEVRQNGIPCFMALNDRVRHENVYHVEVEYHQQQEPQVSFKAHVIVMAPWASHTTDVVVWPGMKLEDFKRRLKKVISHPPTIFGFFIKEMDQLNTKNLRFEPVVEIGCGRLLRVRLGQMPESEDECREKGFPVKDGCVNEEQLLRQRVAHKDQMSDSVIDEDWVNVEELNQLEDSDGEAIFDLEPLPEATKRSFATIGKPKALPLLKPLLEKVELLQKGLDKATEERDSTSRELEAMREAHAHDSEAISSLKDQLQLTTRRHAGEMKAVLDFHEKRNSAFKREKDAQANEVARLNEELRIARENHAELVGVAENLGTEMSKTQRDVAFWKAEARTRQEVVREHQLQLERQVLINRVCAFFLVLIIICFLCTLYVFMR